MTPAPTTSPDVVVERKTLRSRRLVVWVFFSLVFGLLPVVIQGLRLLNDDKFEWATFISAREQFLVIAVLSVGAAGEVLAAAIPEDRKTASISAAASALLSFVANLLIYLEVDKDGLIVAFTWILLPISILASMVCIGLAAGR